MLPRPKPPSGPMLALHAGAVLATHVAAGALLAVLAVTAAAGILRAPRGDRGTPAAPPPSAAAGNVLDV